MPVNFGYVWELHKSWRFKKFIQTSGIESYLDSLGFCLQRTPQNHEILLDSKDFVTIRTLSVSLHEVFLQFHFGRSDKDYHSIYGHRVVMLRVLTNCNNEISCLTSPALSMIYAKRTAFQNQRIALLLTHIDYRSRHCLLPRVASVACKVYSLLSNIDSEHGAEDQLMEDGSKSRIG
ncbi:hypothetical protein BOX15_Mlig007721g2 [Macrostomum lignano]|uniref:Uncharacterized protein n=1 Tax=Macrostomum lignano TaxID=282301 RepID=A0A267EU83_9PLAT|nr:hypothetical protein BOX15_Mlig007721g1 [Macrostomum lignano]PAA81600.1 hypothetical protein BOX15_Mlig007721g2 [Macrostomum lignano]